MMKTILTIALATAAFAGTLAVSSAAEARNRARTVNVQGAGGHGYSRAHSISRAPGWASASRSLQANNGRGIASSRSASWAQGSYSGGAAHVTNNGTSWGRSTSIVNNGDGSYTGTMSRTRPDGSTGSATRTVSRN